MGGWFRRKGTFCAGAGSCLAVSFNFSAFGAWAMTTIETLAPHLPYLRRYARALMGTQELGDAQVRRALSALSSGQRKLPEGVSPRLGLYRIFQSMLSGDAS